MFSFREKLLKKTVVAPVWCKTQLGF